MRQTEQLRGWAIDRAIEMKKAGASEDKTAEEIIATAEKLVSYCFDAETLKSLDADHLATNAEDNAEALQ